MADPVLDASAVLALIFGEQGAAEVAAVLPGACFGLVNLAEVISKLCEHGMPAEIGHNAVRSLGVRLMPFTEEQAQLTGALRQATRTAGLSLGDRACLALGRVTGGLILTADSAWPQISQASGVRVRVIR